MFAASSSAARTQRLALVSVAAFVVLVMIASSANNVFVEANGGEEGGNNIVDAIKYLQGLDKVYGQAARPRVSTSSKSDHQTRQQAAAAVRYHSPVPPMIHRSAVKASGVSAEGDDDDTSPSSSEPSSFIEKERENQQQQMGTTSIRIGRSSAAIDRNMLGDMVRFLQMQQLDRFYDAKRIRPRFGKRGHTLGSPEAAAAAGLPVDFEELPAAQHQQMMRGFY